MCLHMGWIPMVPRQMNTKLWLNFLADTLGQAHLCIGKETCRLSLGRASSTITQHAGL
jgi:hypothetical protein